eukprot:PhM_4_TR17671/c0_g1_i1/m.17687
MMNSTNNETSSPTTTTTTTTTMTSVVDPIEDDVAEHRDNLRSVSPSPDVHGRLSVTSATRQLLGASAAVGAFPGDVAWALFYHAPPAAAGHHQHAATPVWMCTVTTYDELALAWSVLTPRPAAMAHDSVLEWRCLPASNHNNHPAFPYTAPTTTTPLPEFFPSVGEADYFQMVLDATRHHEQPSDSGATCDSVAFVAPSGAVVGSQHHTAVRLCVHSDIPPQQQQPWRGVGRRVTPNALIPRTLVWLEDRFRRVLRCPPSRLSTVRVMLARPLGGEVRGTLERPFDDVTGVAVFDDLSLTHTGENMLLFLCGGSPNECHVGAVLTAHTPPIFVAASENRVRRGMPLAARDVNVVVDVERQNSTCGPAPPLPVSTSTTSSSSSVVVVTRPVRYSGGRPQIMM